MAAFQMFQTEFTFGEMSEKADQFGSALLAMGLQEPGSARICLMLILFLRIICSLSPSQARRRRGGLDNGLTAILTLKALEIKAFEKIARRDLISLSGSS